MKSTFRKSLDVTKSALVTALAMMCILFNINAHAKSSEPMVVLVHGAHLTASSWAQVEIGLGKKGFNSMALNLPGREDNVNPKDITLTSSAKYLCDKLVSVKQKLILVAHSQGGAVVNHALSMCPKIEVERIIYLASVVPLNGEKPFDRLSKADEGHYFQGVEYQQGNGLMVIYNPQAFVATFSSQQTSPHTERIMAASVSEPAAIGEGVVMLAEDSFKAIKKFYIFTEQDKIISVLSQRGIAKQINTIKTGSINSGHIPMITHADSLLPILVEFMSI